MRSKNFSWPGELCQAVTMEIRVTLETASLPIFGDVERPLKFQVGNIVIVNKFAHSLVVTSRHHAARGFLRCEFLLIGRFVAGVWWVATNHFLVLAYPNPFSLQKLDVF